MFSFYCSVNLFHEKTIPKSGTYIREYKYSSLNPFLEEYFLKYQLIQQKFKYGQVVPPMSGFLITAFSMQLSHQTKPNLYLDAGG
jgi:hypothetical protein